MSILIAELDFPWPSFNNGLYWVALGLYRCRNSKWISHLFPTMHFSSVNIYIAYV